MEKLTPREIIKYNLSVKDVADYALSRGWKRVEHPSQLQVFEEPPNEYENPLRFALTSADDFRDAPLRITEVVNLLAAVEDRSPEALIEDIISRSSRLEAKKPRSIEYIIVQGDSEGALNLKGADLIEAEIARDRRRRRIERIIRTPRRTRANSSRWNRPQKSRPH